MKRILSNNTVKWLLSIVIIVFLVGLLQLFAVSLFKTHKNDIIILTSIIVDILVVLSGCYIYRQKLNLTTRKLSTLSILFTIIGFVIYIALESILIIIMPRPVTAQESKEIIYNSVPWLMICLTIIVAPICEEIIFRGIFKVIINNTYLYILVNSVCFGLLHIQYTNYGIYTNLYPAIITSVGGVIFSLLYLKTENIKTNIICHSMSNSLALLTYLAHHF